MMEAFERICSSTAREPWLAARLSGIGSSDAPGILGVSPFASPLSVYADKLGLAEDREQSEAMKWGSILEPLIVQEFAAETGRKAERAGELLRSRANPFQLATLDAVQFAEKHEGPGDLEIKATGWRAGDWTEGVPEHVFVQVQHQLSVTGWGWASVAVLIGGCKLLWADVERDDRFIDDVLLPAEAEFWRRVEAREPVGADASEATARALKALYPKDSGAVIALPGSLIELDHERVELAAQVKALETRKAGIDNEIKLALGEASIGMLANGVTYTHKLQRRAAFSVKATEFRVLRRSAK